MPITLVLIDDHSVVLEGLDQLLRLEPDFNVIAKCSTVAAGIRAIETLRPDVVILDLRLRQEDGFEVLRHLGSRPSPAVVVLTASEDQEDLLEAARLGARGIVLKAVAPRTLERCIRTVHAGGEWLTVEGENLADRLAQRKGAETVMAQKLTSRELEVLRLLASHHDNEDIAQRLDLRVGTVKIHVHHVYQKLGLSGREDLQRYLKRKGY
jgi:two-component system, NarL family, nitrate/nitrite response regulator NarL